MAGSPVFLGYTQEALDRAYDQRAWAPNAQATIALYAALSAAARDALEHRSGIAYGDGPDEVLDLFPAGAANAPVHIHLHGGAWRSLSRLDASLVAPPLVEAGVHVIVPDFSSLPGARMPAMAAQVRRVVDWAYRNAAAFGGDADRITVSGHSSGAHLAAVLAATPWRERGLPATVLKGAFCLGGSYDLEPVLLSARRQYIDLSAEEAAALSPARHAEAIRCPVTVAVGERESPEFRRQAAQLAEALRAAGHAPEVLTAAGLDHFEALVEAARPGSELNRALLRMAAG